MALPVVVLPALEGHFQPSSISRPWSLEDRVAFDSFWKGSWHSVNYVAGLDLVPGDLITKLDLENADPRYGRIDDVFECPPNHFYTPDVTTPACQPYLDCNSIYEQVQVRDQVFAKGIGKQVRAGRWYYGDADSPEQDLYIKIAFVETKPSSEGGANQSPRIQERVKVGALNLLRLQPSRHVQKVLGYCFEDEQNRTLIISEYCAHGNLGEFVGGHFYAPWNTVRRVEFAISLVEAIDYLHNSPMGTRINCDMNRLHRSLTQFLVTEDFRIVLNDVDDIPLVTGAARCSWGNDDRMSEQFIAPEQRYNSTAAGRLGIMHTEKIDIWKLPDMVIHMMLKNCGSEAIRRQVTTVLYTLGDVLRACKDPIASNRPSTRDLLAQMRQVLNVVSDLDW